MERSGENRKVHQAMFIKKKNENFTFNAQKKRNSIIIIKIDYKIFQHKSN